MLETIWESRWLPDYIKNIYKLSKMKKLFFLLKQLVNQVEPHFRICEADKNRKIFRNVIAAIGADDFSFCTLKTEYRQIFN